jgi:serine/threonine-protein kinase RIM15
MEAPLSPRLPSVVPSSRTATTSIKDFDIIKPISKGAFGSVYLAKKRATGDYFAIKALKKSDMIAKNQITNVKAERTILMDQASSPHVAKLFFSFQNKDYLYLVMEYLNGGDCAALVKALGGLPEEWTRNYIAEVVLGLEYLHNRGIVHRSVQRCVRRLFTSLTLDFAIRDLKPDNLLIDSRGHLKLTDFGLSKIGLLNRQIGGPRPAVLRGTSLRRLQGANRIDSPLISSVVSGDSPMMTPESLLPPPMGLSNSISSYFSGRLTDAGSADESSGSESVLDPHSRPSRRASSFGRRPSSGLPSENRKTDFKQEGNRDMPKFVGTPDYLCPESSAWNVLVQYR